MSLRLLWAGPWYEAAPSARLGAAVLAAWARAGHRVEVARTEGGDTLGLSPLPAPGPVHLARVMQPELTGGGYDAVFVVLTDDPALSLMAPWIAAQAPPILLPRDAVLGRLAEAWARHPPSPDPVCIDLRSLAMAALAVMAADAAVFAATDGACLGASAVLPPPVLLPPPGPIACIASICGDDAPEAAGDLIRALAALPGLRLGLEHHPIDRRSRSGKALAHMVFGAVPPGAQARLVRLAQHLASPIPVFCGPCDGEAAMATLAGAGLLCWFGDGDGAAMRALASARPLIRVGAARPESCPGATLCPPGQPALLAYAIQSLIDDPPPPPPSPVEAYAEALLGIARDAIAATAEIQAGQRIREALAGLGLPADPAALATARRGLIGLLAPPDPSTSPA